MGKQEAGVRGANAVMQATRRKLEEWRRDGVGLREIARRLGVNPGLVRQVVAGDVVFSGKMIAAVTGERWGMAIVYFPLREGGAFPRQMAAERPPRQCPITGTWFFPTSWNAKYAPGVSGAEKRAYQRRVYGK